MRQNFYWIRQKMCHMLLRIIGTSFKKLETVDPSDQTRVVLRAPLLLLCLGEGGMLEPLKDLWRAEQIPGVVLPDTQLIGEIHGRLFSITESEEFLERGGAQYACQCKLANRNVVVDQSNYQGSPSHLERHSPSSLSTSCKEWGLWGKLKFWWSRSCNALLPLSRAAAFALPLLRLGFPCAVPRSARVLSCPTRRTGSEKVVAMAFHPRRPLLALAVEEGGLDGRVRVMVLNVVAVTPDTPLSLYSVLTHAFQKHVEALAWKPHSEDVLAVGCLSGVLLWSLEAGAVSCGHFCREEIICGHANGERVYSSSSPSTFEPQSNSTVSRLHKQSSEARCLFYACNSSTPVTALAFSCVSGRFLATGSRYHVALSLVDVGVPPCDVHCCMPLPSTLDGGSEQLLFAEDDTYVLSLTCGHSSLGLLQLRMEALQETHRVSIATPFPVLAAQRAAGVGPHCYVLQVARVEGLIIGRVDAAAKQLSIMTTISTSLVRGIGGLVRTFAASRRRLWMVTETGHLIVCDYHGTSVIPVGVVPMDGSLLASFSGFSMGSLLAVVEQHDVLHLIPSYHA